MAPCPNPWKQAHGSYKEAEQHLKFMAKRRGARKGYGLHVYSCRCGAWHVGHIVPGKKPKRTH